MVIEKVSPLVASKAFLMVAEMVVEMASVWDDG
jgi:hypothetical protein